MSLTTITAAGVGGFSRIMDAASPLFDLALRLWVGWQFFKSGLVKIQSWDSTLMLFEYEYEVPLLSPKAAAFSATAGELLLPVFLALGLAGRLAALGLSVINVVAVVAYASFLLSSDGAAGLQQHILWGVMLAVTLFHGPGKLSLDHLLAKRLGGS